jgi:uracil-DNA glycosylase family 4
MVQKTTEKMPRPTTLATLQREILACDRCVRAGFIPVANPIVRGGARDRIMAIGQAPGARAHEHPLPFSGPFGAALRRWLEQAGFPPEALDSRIYRTSITKCFPGSSPSGKGDRAPSAAEIALCRHHLDREIALVRPRVVLALGRLAAVAFLRPAPLVDLVGTVQTAERGGHRFAVVPLPHPSGVSRWLNDGENRARLDTALALLSDLREREGL